jgi:hypothetical protein
MEAITQQIDTNVLLLLFAESSRAACCRFVAGKTLAKGGKGPKNAALKLLDVMKPMC